MKKLILFLITTSFSLLLFAYPINPRPLRKLIAESEYIVWCYVSKVGTTKQTKKNENIWERDFAIIIIKETLQGKLTTDTIKVYFCSGMICPAPGIFYEGEEVLAFLDKRKKSDGYEVHALSYGIKHGLKQEQYNIYKSRIKEMQEILQTHDANKCDDIIVSWLVKCAEEKATRWEGVYELSPHSDFMSYYDHSELIQKPIYLNNQQHKKLFDVLIAIDTLSYYDIPLADIVRGINDALLLDFLKSRLKRVEENYLWTAEDIMRRIADLTGNPELKQLVEKFGESYFDYTDKEKKSSKKILSTFIIKMEKIPLQEKFSAYGNNNT